jgi:hypothetical protein
VPAATVGNTAGIKSVAMIGCKAATISLLRFVRDVPGTFVTTENKLGCGVEIAK